MPPIFFIACSRTYDVSIATIHIFLYRLTLEAQTWLGFTMLGATTLSLGLFVCVFLVARKHGSRFSRPQTAGYELANQVSLISIS